MSRSTHNTGDSILNSLVNCLAYGAGAGIVISFALICLVLLTGTAHAAVDEDKLARVERLSDLDSGQLVFRAADGHYLTSTGVDTDVDIEVTGLLARVTVSQSFLNPTSQWQEGIYVFPLPETAAVDHLRMKVGERIIEGEIKPKQEARKIYQQAKSAGKRASLIEQQRPNMFTSSVANIAPGDKITVVIEYQQTVTQNQNAFSLRFPMAITPRYIPGKAITNTAEVRDFNGNGWAVNTDQVPDASHITPPVTVTDKNPITLKVHLAAGFPLATVESAYHDVKQAILDNGDRLITLANTVPADRDFELVWQAKASQSPQAALFKQRLNGQDYALLMLNPPSQHALQKTIARELIFVIDTSGSMDGTSIKQARQALQYGLDQLRPQDSFNIIRFSDDTESLFQQARLATQKNIDIAHDFVDWLRADGGTEMAPALKLALSGKSTTQGLRQIVFLTDGSVGNEDELFSLIEQHLGASRLFTVGIGSAPNSHFMNRAAQYGRGSHSYIGEQAEVRQKMQALFSKLAHPVLTDIQINLAGDQFLEQWPQTIPDLYQGEPLMLALKSEALPETITISGHFGLTPWQTTVTLKGGKQSEAVSVLWARRKIAGLMDDYRLENQDETIKQEIVDVALEHHLVSQFTSLVAVDKTPVRPNEQTLNSEAIASNLPAGSTLGQFPQTATSATFQLLLGILLLLSALLVNLVQRRRA
ncbi:MAG TPA: marine proteobacterial sortase target protein [Methylophaga sp.]|nr:marine proteobacterial sortase target protein [Methylophaga sp.]